MASSAGIPKLIGFVPMSQTQTYTWRGGSRAHCARRALVEHGGQETDGANKGSAGKGVSVNSSQPGKWDGGVGGGNWIFPLATDKMLTNHANHQ